MRQIVVTQQEIDKIKGQRVFTYLTRTGGAPRKGDLVEFVGPGGDPSVVCLVMGVATRATHPQVVQPSAWVAQLQVEWVEQ